MPLYQVTDSELSPLDSTDFQSEGVLEKVLEQLLKDNIEVIDPDILVIAKQFHDFKGSNRSIDLLAIDKEANLVVIELKRTHDGGHMDLQAIRYAAMMARMTWDQAKNKFKEYIEENSPDSDADTILTEFFDDKLPGDDEFAQNVRIILVSAGFSKEITTSVLWLNEQALDIRCVRLSLHKLNDELVLSADQIIPLPEAEDYQTEFRQKQREERASRTDKRSSFRLSLFYKNKVYGEPFIMADIGYLVIRLLDEQGLVDEVAFKFLRENTTCNFQLIKKKDQMTEYEKRTSKYRFKNPPELMYDGQEYYVARNWGVTNIWKFADVINARFADVRIAKLEE